MLLECYTQRYSILYIIFSSIANFNFLFFVPPSQPHAVTYDDTYLDRFKDPGVGAFSYHEGHFFAATRYIDAGEELFAGEKIEYIDFIFFASYILCQNDEVVSARISHGNSFFVSF